MPFPFTLGQRFLLEESFTYSQIFLVHESSSWIFEWTFQKDKKVLYLSVQFLTFKKQANMNFDQIVLLCRETIYGLIQQSFNKQLQKLTP